MHGQDIAASLAELRDRFDDAGIPFAVIGALALRQHGYSRYTEDIDILTTSEGLRRIHDEMIGLGIVPRATGLRKKLRETKHKVDLDVIQAGEGAGSDGSPVRYPDPRSDAFVAAPDGVRYPTLATLITFKIASGIWGNRLRDLADAQELIHASELDERFADNLPESVRGRYLELLLAKREERDIE